MSTDSIALDQLREIAARVRVFLEPRWSTIVRDDGRESAGSKDMCLLSSAFLRDVLQEEIPGEEWLVVGGTDERGDAHLNREASFPGGFRDASGRFHGHYWVTDGDYGVVLDVTADQFGGPPVLVALDTLEADLPYVENYAEWGVEERSHNVRHRIAGWMGEWRAENVPAGPRL